MGRIKKLDEKLISLIAAGEVVEGPWSVVKELVENSLDAGASRIEVAVADAGFGEIKVTDDGVGMDVEDLRLAFERYATSKISRPEDLDALATLGFRGEALAAIAAASKVIVYTRPANVTTGWRAEVVDGRVNVTEEGVPAGTTVIVRDLFYNVPARRKFAGTAQSEWRRVVDVFRRLALAQLGPAFKLTRGGRLQYATGGGSSIRQRVGEILGWDIVEQLLPVSAAREEIKLDGFVGPPHLSFAGMGSVYTVINGRPARAKALARAISAAYAGWMERGRYPLVVIYLNVPPGEVDVNVHPRKEEVRFARESLVYEFVGENIIKALASKPAAATRPAARGQGISGGETTVWAARARDAVEGYLRRHGLAAVGEMSYDAVTPTVGATATATTPGETVEVLGQLNDTYIIVRRGRDLVVIDQHTAHERVIYDRLAKGAAGGAPGACQTLLLPEVVTLPADIAADVRACLPGLRDLAFDVEEFGGGAFLVRGRPADLDVGDIASFFRQVADDYAGAGRPDGDGRRSVLMKSIACRAAVMAGRRLEPEEMAALVADLFATSMPTVCPHGRPTMVNVSPKDLEKWFKR